MPGFPAARIGDSVTHDRVTPSGLIGEPLRGPFADSVLIEHQEAAHVACTVLCNGATAQGPAHPPPPAPALILTGSLTVLIHGRAAARWDPSQDIGGCMVFLGKAAEAATRTVLIGGPVFPLPIVILPGGVVQVGNNITIGGDPEYQAKVIADLFRISLTPIGLARLDSLDSLGKPVRIVPCDKDNPDNSTMPDKPADAAAKGTRAKGTLEPGTGDGTGSEIHFDADFEPPTAKDPSVKRPADVGLQHELTHAEHNARGNGDHSGDDAHPNNGTKEETETIKEDNEYRRERGIPERDDHTTL
jgi:hypothetical protein